MSVCVFLRYRDYESVKLCKASLCLFCHLCRHDDQPGITVPMRGLRTYRSRLVIQKGDVVRRQTADCPPAQEIAAHPCPNPQTPGNVSCTIHSKGPLHDYFTITYSLTYYNTLFVCLFMCVGTFAPFQRLEYHIFTSQEYKKHKMSIRNLKFYGIICTMVTIQ